MAAVVRPYLARLPEHMSKMALISGALSAVAAYTAQRDPTFALLAMAVGSVASLVDSSVRPLFDGWVPGGAIGAVYIFAKTAVSIGVASSLIAAYGLPALGLRVGGYVLVNFILTGVFSLIQPTWAAPYSIGA